MRACLIKVKRHRLSLPSIAARTRDNWRLPASASGRARRDPISGPVAHANAEYAVNHALKAIKDAHRSLAAVVHAMHDQVARIRAGGCRADFDALRAMLYYLDAYSARQHHPHEEEFLLQPLRAHGGEAAAVVEDVEREHARIAEAMRSLEQALLRYEEGGEREFVAFATAVEGFCGFYLGHMGKEETLVLPLAERLLGAQEWARVDAACAASQESRGGVDEDEELRHLFSRIVGAQSAPDGSDPPATPP